MPFNGSGVYQLPATTVTPAVGATTIASSDFNTFTADLATALSLCLTEDGQNQPTANLPMATFRHTGISDGTALTDYASVNQVVDNALTYGGTSAVETDAYAVNLTINPGAYTAGMRAQFIADVANTGACTIDLNSNGAQAIKMQDGADPPDNYIVANSIVDVEFDGINMVLQGVPSVGVNTTSVQTLTNKTIQGGAITLDTEQAASGTSMDFSGIPSWAKRVTVMLDELSSPSAGNSAIIIQLGDSVGIETTGYKAACTDGALSTTGFILSNNPVANAEHSGSITFKLMDATNTWAAQGGVSLSGITASFAGGRKTLSGTLTQIRITTSSGTDVFDAGSANISYS